MAEIFHRRELAAVMAHQLLRPSVLDEGLRSGLFLSGLRRTGKTTFLLNDLIPALEELGALVVYVDLWSDPSANQAAILLGSVRKLLDALQTPASTLSTKLKVLKGMDIAFAGFKFGFRLDKLGTDGGPTLAQALSAVVDQAKADIVLIVDEVQQAIVSDDESQMLFALKAARDAINLRPNTPGHLIFIGTGSHRALVSELTARRTRRSRVRRPCRIRFSTATTSSTCWICLPPKARFRCHRTRSRRKRLPPWVTGQRR